MAKEKDKSGERWLGWFRQNLDLDLDILRTMPLDEAIAELKELGAGEDIHMLSKEVQKFVLGSVDDPVEGAALEKRRPIAPQRPALKSERERGTRSSSGQPSSTANTREASSGTEQLFEVMEMEKRGSNILAQIGVAHLVVAVIGLSLAGIGIWFGFFHEWPRTVQGIVQESNTEEPLNDVAMTIEEREVRTTDDGKYYFAKAIKPGFYQYRAVKEGYEDFTGTIQVIEDVTLPIIKLTPIKPALPVYTVEITEPGKNGMDVTQSIQVKGRAVDIPPDLHPWVVVHPTGSIGWWPQVSELVVNPSDSSWVVEAIVGATQDGGKSFDIVVVLADQDAHRAFNRYLQDALATGNYPERPLPAGTDILDNVTVIRD